MQEAGRRLMARPRLGIEVFARGAPEPLTVVTHTRYEASLFDLLQAYARQTTRVEATQLRIVRSDLYSVDDAIQRLRGLLGSSPGWRSLSTFLPADLRDALVWRSALAATFTASLELCRQGKLRIRQDGTYGPIYLRGAGEET
jgi:segregation and condensation protein A